MTSHFALASQLPWQLAVAVRDAEQTGGWMSSARSACKARVFAFEEAVAFENGRLSSGQISVDMVHLKGHGAVLLKLEGTLKAMAVPAGTPLKVPLSRLVGWYGHVSPRVMMGFVGQASVELTGEGYALLSAPG